MNHKVSKFIRSIFRHRRKYRYAKKLFKENLVFRNLVRNRDIKNLLLIENRIIIRKESDED